MAILSSPIFQYISSTPPATRSFAALLLLLSGTYYWLQWRQPEVTPVSLHPSVPFLTLIPGLSWIYPWTFLTSSFVEKTVFELIFSLISLPLSLRYLERLWGTLETFKFIGTTLVVSNVVAFIVSWVEYLVLGSEFFVYGLEYHGQMALQTGVLVAFTQMIPEHQVQLFGVLKMRVKRLPMIYVTFSTAMCLVGYQDPFILIQFGWLVSWTYLRFYKRTGGDTPGGGPVEYGDRSETFAFIYWFPPFIHYPLSIAVNSAHALALRLRLVPQHSGSTADLEAGGYAPLPGGARAEAERRRAMALKALDQRLANPAQNPGASVPPQSLPSVSSHHPTLPAHDPPSSHSHPHPPPRQNGAMTSPPLGLSAVPQQAKPVSRGEEPDGDADVGVALEKGVRGSAGGTVPT
ncbi:eukaryotic integral membrane protein-domain-containing protein [Gautieria morchelliformis]|nr:eukaryotic integral membrane protein-domain-containing protein [Gautieria morchelliformis]